ncbi:MAG: DUF4355 domain-containing protein [Firmicutes bacterium]|nr:DUF4355 domain-containing protein [Bacillota bacterium]
MENNKDMVTTTETVENSTQVDVGTENKKAEKTYTRAELNKIISAEKEKIKAEIIQEAEAKKTEAEKLAKMDADEKHKYELEKAEKEKNDALSKLNAYELKEQAMKIATEKELDISLLELIDYGKENAETVKTKLETMKSVMDKAIEKEVNKRLQEKGPKQIHGMNFNSDQEYLNKKYGNNPYFNKGK